MSSNYKTFYEFGPFRVDAAEQQLWRDGSQIPLTPKAFGVLLLLVRNSGHTLPKDDFMKEVWPDAFVEENNLADNISTLRKVLGDDAKEPRYIKTVPRRGYCFVAEVTEVRDEGADIVLAEYVKGRIVIEEEHESHPADAPELNVRANAAHSLTFPSAPERRMRRRMSPLTIAVVCVLLGGMAIAAYLTWQSRRDRSAGRPVPLASSMAVLPFKPLFAQSSDPALELGMTDALITKLSNIKQMIVRPTSSVLKYGTADQDLRAVGSELGVDVLLDGKIQKVGDRVRLSVQLVRASDGAPVWGESFDEKFTDIFALQDRVSERVAAALSLKLTGEEKKELSKRYTNNTEAYELYLKGRHHWSTFKPEELLTSINYYNEALKRDPDYALAYSGIANAYIVIGIYGPLTAKEAMPRASEAAQKAVEIDNDLAEAHVALGAVKIFHEWDWPGAELELRRALELSPNNMDAHSLYGYYLQAAGKEDAAVAEEKRARELAPEWFIANNDFLLALFKARRYDEAIEQSRQVVKLDPNDVFAYYIIGISQTQQGNYAEAAEALQRAVKNPFQRALASLGYFYAVTGKKGDALMIIQQLQEKPTHRLPVQVAEIYAGLGDKDQAFAWLEKGYEARYPLLWEVRSYPQFDSLRSDPRYIDLMRRIRLQP